MRKLKFVATKEEISGALKKAGIDANVDYNIIGSGAQKDENGSSVFGILSCSSSMMAQAQIVFHAKILEGDEKGSFICGPELEKAVNNMSGIGNELTFDYQGAFVEISCDAGSIKLDCKEKMASMDKSMGKEDMLGVIMNAEHLKMAVHKGANYAPVDNMVVAKDTFELKICDSDGSVAMRAYSSDLYKGSLCEVPVIKAGYISGAEGNQASKNISESRYALKCRIMDFVVNNLDEEVVQLMFQKSTVSIKSGNAVYTLALLERKFPKEIEKIFFDRDEISKVSLSKKELQSAINLALIASGNAKPLIFAIQKDGVEVRDIFGKSKVKVPGEAEGAAVDEIGFSFDQMRAILAKTHSDKLLMTTQGSRKATYFFDDVKGAVAFLLPVKVS